MVNWENEIQDPDIKIEYNFIIYNNIKLYKKKDIDNYLEEVKDDDNNIDNNKLIYNNLIYDKDKYNDKHKNKNKDKDKDKEKYNKKYEDKFRKNMLNYYIHLTNTLYFLLSRIRANKKHRFL